MTTAYRVTREGASRVASAPCHVAPPLREVWRESSKGMVWHRPLIQDGLVVRHASHGVTVGLDEWTWAQRWSRRKGAAFLHEGLLYFWKSARRLELVGADGRKQSTRTVPCGIDVAQVRDILVGWDFDKGRYAFGADLRDVERIWRYRPPLDDSHSIQGIFCADERGVYLGLSDGSVVGLSLRDGEEMWRQPAAGFQEAGKPKRTPMGFLTAHDGRVIVRYPSNVAAVSTRDGRVVWQQGDVWGTADGYLYDGRYYVTAVSGEYCVLDPRTGKVLLRADLRATLPRDVKPPLWDFAPLLVSETHVFTGTGQGWLLAFERDTGRYAWHFRPKGGGPISTRSCFSSVNGRLYYSDLSYAEYCLEEETPTDPVLKERRAQAEAEGRVWPRGMVWAVTRGGEAVLRPSGSRQPRKPKSGSHRAGRRAATTVRKRR